MEDFFAADPSKMNYKELADRAKYFKEPGKGGDMMSDVMGDFVNELMKRQGREIALNFIKKGTSRLVDIADATGLSLEEVEELAKKKTA